MCPAFPHSVMVRLMHSSALGLGYSITVPVCNRTGHLVLTLALLHSRFPTASDLHYYSPQGWDITVSRAVTPAGQVIFLLTDPSLTYVVISDVEETKQVTVAILEELRDTVTSVRQEVGEVSETVRKFMVMNEELNRGDEVRREFKELKKAVDIVDDCGKSVLVSSQTGGRMAMVEDRDKEDEDDDSEKEENVVETNILEMKGEEVKMEEQEVSIITNFVSLRPKLVKRNS
jgi:hypothetical protein